MASCCFRRQLIYRRLSSVPRPEKGAAGVAARPGSAPQRYYSANRRPSFGGCWRTLEPVSDIHALVHRAPQVALGHYQYLKKSHIYRWAAGPAAGVASAAGAVAALFRAGVQLREPVAHHTRIIQLAGPAHAIARALCCRLRGRPAKGVLARFRIFCPLKRITRLPFVKSGRK